MSKELTAFIATVIFSCLMHSELDAQVLPASNDSTQHRTYAMIMGISTYKFIRPLSFADSDADLFRDFLKSQAGGGLKDTSIYFLKNEEAKQASFWVKGSAWLTSKNLKKGDKLYIYLAGHGDAINEDEFFFLTYDCNPAGDKNNYIITGSVPLYVLKSRMKRMAQTGVEVIFIMDACRTNELPGGGAGQQLLNQAITERKVGDIMMLAASSGQESLEDASIGTGHGLFTYFLVEGLVGMADSPGAEDGKISLVELQNYVIKSVSNLASEKYKRKQDPVFCCTEFNDTIIANVDTAFLRKWILAKQLRGQLRGSEINSIASNFKTRGSIEAGDTSVLEIYNSFNKALKEFNLVGGNGSAENYYEQLNKLAPTSSYTQDARLSLATEFINFAQGKINLYLEGRDVASIQRIRSQLDADDKSDEITNSLDRMEKVARQDFSQVAEMLEKAMGYGVIDDEFFLRKLKAQSFFFKAQGYLEKGGDAVGLKHAIQNAMQAYRAEPKAAYILNTLASLQLDNNKPDSAVYFAKKAIELAPLWRYPYVNAANAFSKKNKPDSALVYFKKALAVDDSRADAYVDLGYFYFQQHKPDSAKAYYEKALLLDPKNAPAYNNMGWLLRETRQLDQALSYFRKSISYDSTFFNAYNGISRVFTDMRMYDSARAYYQKAMKNYPDKLITTNYIGQFYQELNQVDSARAYFVQAAVYDPNYDAPYINLGKLYAQMKHYDSAIYFYNKAIELNNKNFRGFNQLGMLYTETKNYDSAFHYYQKGLELNPDNPIVLNNIGLAYYTTEKFDSAAKYFTTVIEISPDNPYAINNLGMVYNKMKNADSAMAYYTRALELKPDLESAQINMGLVLSEKQEYEKAKYYFRTVLEAHPQNFKALSGLEYVFKQTDQADSSLYYNLQTVADGIPNTYMFNHIGRLYFDLEKFDSAASWYNKAIELEPDNAIGYGNLGAVFVSLQHLDSAVVMYKKAVSLDSNYFNALLNLGIVYNIRQQYDSAILILQKAIKLNFKNNLAYYYLAVSYAATNRPQDALLNLRIALENGFENVGYIIAEPELDSIRKYPAYKEMMKKHFPKDYKYLEDK